MAQSRRRWPWILLAIILVLPLGALGALWLFLDAEALRPRIVAAVESATGRRFTVGAVGLGLSLTPRIELRDVALANAEGGSRPEMLTARRVAVSARLLPLLSRRVEIARIEVEAPDLLLETDAQGRPNWAFAPREAPAGPGAPPPQPSSAPRQMPQLGIDALRLTEGRVTWRDARSGVAEVVAIPALDIGAPIAGPTTLEGQVALRGQTVAVEATTGAVAAFGGAEPWPFRAMLGVAGAEARAEGRLAAEAAWSVALDVRAADLTRLAALLPDVPLPPLRDITASGRAAGRGAEVVSAGDLALRIGASDLSVLRPGLALRGAQLTAASLDAPLALAAEATLGGAPLRLTGTAGAPAILLGRSAGPLPLDLRLETNGATARMQGRIAEPRAMAGVDLALSAEAADLAALSPLAGTPLPAIRELRASARLSERTPGFQGGAHLRDIELASAQGDLAGNLTLVVGERPGLAGRLSSRRIDLDAILAAMPARATQPAPQAHAQAPPARDRRVIPPTPLPLNILRLMDADVTLAVQELRLREQPWRQLTTRLGIDAGYGRLAPLSVTTPAGAVTLEIEGNARQATPTLRLVLRAPALDLAAAQAMAGQPTRITGQAEIEADLRGAGGDLRAVAATLGGHLGIAVLEGTLEPALTAPIIATLRERVPVLPQLPQRLPLDCVAIRAEAQDGTARIGTLLLDAPAAKVAGSGTVNLRDESLALRMLHDVRAAGATIRVAADLGGTLANPGYRGVQAQNLGELLGGLAGRVGGDAGALLGALAARPGARPEPLPECGPALVAARGGRQGAVPAARVEPAPAPAQPQQPAQPARPQDLLRDPGAILRGLQGLR